MPKKNTLAVPNSFTKWPASRSDFDTTPFHFSEAHKIVEFRDTNSVKGSYSTILMEFCVSEGFSQRWPGSELDWSKFANYFAGYLELLNIAKHLGLHRVVFSRNPHHIYNLLSSVEAFNGISFISFFGSQSFDEIHFTKPPSNLGELNRIREKIDYSQGVDTSEGSLRPNPFSSPEMIDQIHDVRHRLKVLLSELSAVNDSGEWEFERRDLLALLRQTLVQLGEEGEVPTSVVEEVPSAANKLAERVLRTSNLSSATRKIIENIHDLLDWIVKLFP